MDDIANLQIRVGSSDVSTANQRLSTLTRTGGRAERATDGLTTAFKRLAVQVISIGTVVKLTSDLVSTQREFDRLNASIITITGSAKAAGEVFQVIQQFANDTPYDLAQVTDAWVKLTNYGLTPSQRALTSYGDTASAMGKDLSQMIEAVADATTMEFERLKEFGIKANAQGNTIKFTFRGVTTEVAKNSQDIEKYLMAIGENNFAGAMEKRMNTLDGAISNLGDAWSKLQLSISKAGVGDVIQQDVRLATSALNELTDMVSSGQMGAYFNAMILQWSTWEKDVIIFIDNVAGYFGVSMNDVQGTANDAVKFLVSAFQAFPANVKAFIQIMTVEVAHGFEVAVVRATEFQDRIKAIFTKDTQADVTKRTEQALKALDQARLDSIDYILSERNAAVGSFEEQIKKAQELRKQYELSQLALKNNTVDPLAKWGIKTGGATSSAAATSTDKQIEEASKQLQAVRESLQTENEAVESAYENRLFIIENSYQLGLISYQTYAKIREQNELQHQANLGNLEAQGLLKRQAFEKATMKQRTQTILSDMIALTQGVAQNDRTMFEINKQASAASALINTYESFTKTLAAYPYPFNVVMAGLSLAAGMAQVSAIESTSFTGGGSGTTPSVAGSVPTLNSTAVDTSTAATSPSTGVTQVDITLNGLGYSKEDVRDLIQKINEEVGDGVVLRVAG